MDIFLSVAYDFYYDKLNHAKTFDIELESAKPAYRQSKSLVSPTTFLRFPSKLMMIEKQKGIEMNLLIVSDCGNNRLLVLNEETHPMQIVHIIGTGKVGLVDGSFEEAQFHHPQGLCHIYRDNQHFIYLCDTKNHAIREINLTSKEVLTVVGTGDKGFDREGNKDPEV